MNREQIEHIRPTYSEMEREATVPISTKRLNNLCNAALASLDKDARIAELEAAFDRINRVAATKTVNNWLALPAEDKRTWFAATLRADKAKADMIRFLEDRAEKAEAALRDLVYLCRQQGLEVTMFECGDPEAKQ